VYELKNVIVSTSKLKGGVWDIPYHCILTLVRQGRFSATTSLTRDPKTLSMPLITALEELLGCTTGVYITCKIGAFAVHLAGMPTARTSMDQ
jgi:hypothetical protein